MPAPSYELLYNQLREDFATLEYEYLLDDIQNDRLGIKVCKKVDGTWSYNDIHYRQKTGKKCKVIKNPFTPSNANLLLSLNNNDKVALKDRAEEILNKVDKFEIHLPNIIESGTYIILYRLIGDRWYAQEVSNWNAEKEAMNIMQTISIDKMKIIKDKISKKDYQIVTNIYVFETDLSGLVESYLEDIYQERVEAGYGY